MSNKVYDIVTQRILGQLEKVDVNDYSKPWFNIGTSPINIESKKVYKGINRIMLSGFESNHFGTFKQWGKRDCKVKKGEKASPVVKWTFFEDEDTGETKGVSVRYFNVFNSTQVIGDYARELESKPLRELNDHKAIKHADEFVHSYLKNERITIKHSDIACHRYSIMSGLTQHIEMPELGQFKTPQEYYSTFFHEITHSTGAENRLKRAKGKRGTKEYAFEELIAELGAAFLCADLNLEQTPREDHAIYLKSWIQALKNDSKFIIQAASKAQKSCDFVHESVNNYQEFLTRKAA